MQRAQAMVHPKTLVVTPTYNEADNLDAFVDAVLDRMPDAQILVVDDNSPDGTGDVADRIAAREPRVRVHHRPAKSGLGSAYLESWRWGLERDFAVFVEMDADLSHDPAYLPALLAAIESGADMAVGSRNIPGGGVSGWGPGRKLLSKGGSLYSRMLLGVAVRDLTTGFKAIRREVLEAIDLDRIRSEGYSFQIEVSFRALVKGFRLVEVPIVFVDRRAGQSKMSLRIFLEAVVMVPWLRWRSRRWK
jgi:dolichol-phosphate mannosyltransferase